MKSIDELGISHAPWKCATDDNGEIIGIENRCGFYVVRFAVDVKPNDARLIAAAPELYECLRKFVNDVVCRRATKDCDNCKMALCWVKKAKAVLAKASGEVA